MLVEDIKKLLPKDWQPMNVHRDRLKVLTIPRSSPEYELVLDHIRGTYYAEIQGIYKVQNPLLYAKFQIKMEEYKQRGPYYLKWLYHDTARENTHPITLYNLDWRYGERFKFGPGVYFSVSPFLANKHSSRTNGYYRTMFVTNVLVQKVQEAEREIFLPDIGYDTVLCHNGETYVKYFDCEYYPQYFAEYISYC